MTVRTSWAVELPQLGILAVLFVWAALLWPTLPERVPVHWDIAGNVDRYGSRADGLLMLLVLPVTGLLVYVLLRFLPLVDPARVNYRLFGSAYAAIRVTLMVVLGAIGAAIFLATAGQRIDMLLVIHVLVSGLFIVLGAVMGKIRPNWFVGVRTPWTLTSKTSWVRTHRLGGYLFLGLGALFLITLPLRGNITLFAIVVLSLAAAFWLVVYSYLVWRRDPDRVLAIVSRPADE